MKILLIVVGSIVGLIGTIVVAVFFFTSGLTTTADDFFRAVKQANMARARTYLSEGFKANTDEAALKVFLTKAGLLNYKDASWSNRSFKNNRGALDGTITTDTGGSVPLHIEFIKEQDAWKIYSMEKPNAGLASSKGSSPALPNKAEQLALAKKSMHDFAASVSKKNMEQFRASVSKLWQDQFPVEKMNQAYASIIKLDSDLTNLDSLEPVLDSEPTIDANGVLLITGHYATKPSQVFFENKYVDDGSGWKLLGFNINIK